MVGLPLGSLKRGVLGADYSWLDAALSTTFTSGVIGCRCCSLV